MTFDELKAKWLLEIENYLDFLKKPWHGGPTEEIRQKVRMSRDRQIRIIEGALATDEIRVIHDLFDRRIAQVMSNARTYSHENKPKMAVRLERLLEQTKIILIAKHEGIPAAVKWKLSRVRTEL